MLYLPCKTGGSINYDGKTGAGAEPTRVSANSMSNLNNSTPNTRPDSCIGTRRTEDIEKTLTDKGFQFNSVGANGTLREAVSTFNGEEIKVVLIHGQENSLQDVRVQTFREITDKKRKSIEQVAGSILKGIQCGDLPEAFLTKFRKGLQISSDEKVSNGFVYLRALQSPSGASTTDRISLDISFEEFSE